MLGPVTAIRMDPAAPDTALGWALPSATAASLMKRKQDKLVTLCLERGIALDGHTSKWTKKAMVEALLHWRAVRAAEEAMIIDSSPPRSPGTAVPQPRTLRHAVSRIWDDSEDAESFVYPSPSTRGRALPIDSRQELCHPPIDPILSAATSAADDDDQCHTPPVHELDDKPAGALDLKALGLVESVIPRAQLVKRKKIGSGGFKDVYSGSWKGYRVAIAELKGQITPADIQELLVLRDLNHENIVKFIGVSPESPVQIITECCRNGDLYHYMRAVKEPGFLDLLDIAIGISRGLEYLHSRTPAVIHRDVKSLNILITSTGKARLADFGLARVKRTALSMCATSLGTINWQAPELWAARPSYTNSVDVYAAGLVMWEMTCWSRPQFPFQGASASSCSLTAADLQNEHEIYERVGKQRHRPSTLNARRKYGRPLVALIERMWNAAPSVRPSMAECLADLNLIRSAAVVEQDKRAVDRLRNVLGGYSL